MSRQQPINITIPEPCQQSWDEMTVNGKDKFCTACKKTVVDFTHMSDAALFDYIRKNGIGCGRFLDTQLDRIIAPPMVPKRKFWPQLLLSLGMFFGLVKESNGQQMGLGYELIQTDVKPDTANQEKKNGNRNLIVEGIVIDENGNPLPGAEITISIHGINKGHTVTNFDGEYGILMAKNELAMNQAFDISAKWLNFSMQLNVILSHTQQKVHFKLNTALRKNYTTGLLIRTIKSNRQPLVNPRNPTVCTRVFDE